MTDSLQEPNGAQTDIDSLRDRLIEAMDNDGLEALCTRHRTLIAANFHSWRKVPEHLRRDEEKLQRYVEGLYKIAEIFADRLQDESLMELLTRRGESNPLAEWESDLLQIQSLMGNLQFEQATAQARKWIDNARKLTGSAVENFLPVTYGKLGESLFQAGEIQEAQAITLKALELCKKYNDEEGLLSYTGNLFEICRYLDDSESAAYCARKIASILEGRGNSVNAQWYRRRAEIIEKGEPLNRVVASYEGNYYEIGDLPPPVSAHVQVIFERNRIPLSPSQFLNEQGMQIGSEGRYQEALGNFKEAARLDEFNPNPWYQEGNTYLLMGEAEKALASLKEGEKRAPGWYKVRSDIWLAEQLLQGEISHNDFLMLRNIEHLKSTEEKLARSIDALKQSPGIPHLYIYYGEALEAAGRLQEAQKAYHEGLQHTGDIQTKTALLFHRARVESHEEQKVKLLKDAIDLNGDLGAAAMAALMLKGGWR